MKQIDAPAVPDLGIIDNFAPAVGLDVFALRPDYCALSIVADGVVNTASHPVVAALAEDTYNLANHPAWAEAHLEAWRAAYRTFGAKPQRTPCSAEALLKRLGTDGRLPTVNAVVDLYNAVSVRYALPVGGENAAAYQGIPRLIRAIGLEQFDTIRDGAPYSEAVPAGEVIWCDDRGVTCRRWNWRQGIRTRIDAATTRMWFVLERLDPMPLPALLEAGDLLASTLSAISCDARITTVLINQAGLTWKPQLPVQNKT